MSFVDETDPGPFTRFPPSAADATIVIGLPTLETPKAPSSDCLVLTGDSLDASEEGRVILSGAGGGAWEASVAGVAGHLALDASESNSDLLPIAVAGAVADASSVSRLPALDASLLAEAEKRGLLEAGPPVHFRGNMIEAIATSTRPFVPRLSGRAQNARGLLERLRISSALDWTMMPAGDRKRLADALALRLLSLTGRASSAETVSEPSLSSKSLGDLAQLSLGSQALARGEAGRIAAHLMGIRIPTAELKAAAGEANDNLMKLGLRLEREGLKELERIDYFYTAAPGNEPAETTLANDSFSTKGITVGVSANGEVSRMQLVASPEATRRRFDALDSMRASSPPGSLVFGNHRRAASVVPVAAQSAVLQSLDKTVEAAGK